MLEPFEPSVPEGVPKSGRPLVLERTQPSEEGDRLVRVELIWLVAARTPESTRTGSR